MHDRQKPDYPAAANYFRKALEDVIQTYFPKWETADVEVTQLPDYKLGPLIYRAKRFLDKTGISSDSLNQLITLLSCLLHPLSHHEITSPVYRGELLIIEKFIPKLISELKAINIQNSFKCSKLEGRNKVRIKFIINATTGHYSFYELRTLEPLVLKLNPVGAPSITKVKCVSERVWGENNGQPIPRSKKEFTNAEKEQSDLNFLSLQDAYDRLHARMIQFPAIGNFAKVSNYLDAIEFIDHEGNLQPINTILV